MTLAGSCTLLQGCILLHTVVLMVVQQLFGRAQDTCLTKHRSLPQSSLSSQVCRSHTLVKGLPCVAGSGRGAKARAQSDGVMQHIGQLPTGSQVCGSRTLIKVLPCIAGSGRGAKARAQSDGVLQHTGQLPSGRQVSAGAGLAQPELSRRCAP